MKSIVTKLSILVPLFLASGPDVQAQDKSERIKGPHGEFKESVSAKEYQSAKTRITNFRRKEMRAISAHYRALEAVIRYRAPFEDALRMHAAALQVLANRLPKNFVEGTAMTPGKWGAKSEIWSESDRFKRHYTSFQQSITNLNHALARGDTAVLPDQLKLVRHECLACHKNFRVRRKKR